MRLLVSEFVQAKNVTPAFDSKWKYQQISRRRLCFLKYTELSNFTLLFCSGRLRKEQM